MSIHLIAWTPFLSSFHSPLKPASSQHYISRTSRSQILSKISAGTLAEGVNKQIALNKNVSLTITVMSLFDNRRPLPPQWGPRPIRKFGQKWEHGRREATHSKHSSQQISKEREERRKNIKKWYSHRIDGRRDRSTFITAIHRLGSNADLDSTTVLSRCKALICVFPSASLSYLVYNCTEKIGKKLMVWYEIVWKHYTERRLNTCEWIT